MKALPLPTVNPGFPTDFIPLEGTRQDCEDCGNAERLGFQFDYAYQPIVDLDRC